MTLSAPPAKNQSQCADGSDELLPHVTGACAEALGAAEAYLDAAKAAVSQGLDGKGLDGKDAGFDHNQFALHGYAWLATYVAALGQMLAWARRLEAQGKLGELEALMLQAAFGEYLAQMVGGIALAQGEIVRPGDLGIDTGGLEAGALAGIESGAAAVLARLGNSAQVRDRIARLIGDGAFGAVGYGDDTLELVQAQFRRFADERLKPHAQDWHLRDALIPMAVIDDMAALGVFGLTVAEAHGGHGMSREALAVVTEELSRGYLGAGSLGTRSEIAAELIAQGGTEDQKARFLPGIASGAIIPTAVFTEPDAGSDLGAIKTRAVRKKGTDTYVITGAKTWTTHGARSDLMTLLARTDADAEGYRGLSMFLAVKPRGTDASPFPAKGMSGSEIQVLGYRGMKEYEIAFDGFEVEAENLLGGVEGQGFRQLMQTFESARIHTAARATGVAQAALEEATAYAHDRHQFGRPIAGFQRVGGKLAWMATETMIARQLSLFAARQKDSGRRCDIEAGMAKLLAARIAWANADNAVQIFGGNGYAVETPVSRLLLDARILNIFEGAAEIQAHIIARGLLEGRN